MDWVRKGQYPVTEVICLTSSFMFNPLAPPLSDSHRQIIDDPFGKAYRESCQEITSQTRSHSVFRTKHHCITRGSFKITMPEVTRK